MTVFDKAEAGRIRGHLPRTLHENNTWQKPVEGFLKLNWDASLDGAHRRMGIGIAIRKSEGILVSSMSAVKENVTDLGTAEALAAWQAAEVAQRLGLRRVVLEGDALAVINIFKMDEPWLGSYGHILQDAKQRLGQSGRFIMSIVQEMGWHIVLQNWLFQ